MGWPLYVAYQEKNLSIRTFFVDYSKIIQVAPSPTITTKYTVKKIPRRYVTLGQQEGG